MPQTDPLVELFYTFAYKQPKYLKQTFGLFKPFAPALCLHPATVKQVTRQLLCLPAADAANKKRSKRRRLNQKTVIIFATIS